LAVVVINFVRSGMGHCKARYAVIFVAHSGYHDCRPGNEIKNRHVEGFEIGVCVVVYRWRRWQSDAFPVRAVCVVNSRMGLGLTGQLHVFVAHSRNFDGLSRIECEYHFGKCVGIDVKIVCGHARTFHAATVVRLDISRKVGRRKCSLDEFLIANTINDDNFTDIF